MMKIITVLAAGVGAWIVHYVSGSYWGQDRIALGIVGLISVGFGVGPQWSRFWLTRTFRCPTSWTSSRTWARDC